MYRLFTFVRHEAVEHVNRPVLNKDIQERVKKFRRRKVKVMTFNVWNYNDGNDWMGDRKHSIAKIINDVKPEVVGLNEVRRDYGCVDHVEVKSEEGIGCENDMFRDLRELLPEEYEGEFMTGMRYEDIQTVEGVALFTRLPYNATTVTSRIISSFSLESGSGGVDAVENEKQMMEIGYKRFLTAKKANQTLNRNAGGKDSRASYDANLRVALHIALDISSGNHTRLFHVFATHWSYDPREQITNAEKLMAFIAETAAEHVRSGAANDTEFQYAVLGDLNMNFTNKVFDSDSKGYLGTTNPVLQRSRNAVHYLMERNNLLDAHFFKQNKSAWNAADFTYCSCKITPEDQQQCALNKRIDYVLMHNSTSASSSVVDGFVPDYEIGDFATCPSDHRPFVADIRFRFPED